MTPQWILNDIWNEGYEDGRGGHGESNPYTHADEDKAYTEGYNAGCQARWRKREEQGR